MCTHAHNHTVCSHVHLSLLSCAAPVCPFVPQDLEHSYCPCPVKTQMCLTRVLLALSSLTLLSGRTVAGIPCDQFPQIQDDYLQKLQAKLAG